MAHPLGRLVAKIPAVRLIREDRHKTEQVEKYVQQVSKEASESAHRLRLTTERSEFWGRENHVSAKVGRAFGGHYSAN